MGLFSPKASQAQMQHAQTLLKQLQESAKLVNTTLKVQVFFARLNFVFDILLELQQYEKYSFYIGEPPSQAYNRTLSKLEYTVNDFIDRVFNSEMLKIVSLTTEKSKTNRKQKLIDTMTYGFDNAHTFWQGNIRLHSSQQSPHYTGYLYTKGNLEYLKKRCELLYDNQIKINN